MTGAAIPLGAHPGNTGGKKGRSGRPKDELRALMRESLPAAIAVAQQCIDDEDASYADRLKAGEFLAKYGVGTQSESDVTVQQKPQAVQFTRSA